MRLGPERDLNYSNGSEPKRSLIRGLTAFVCLKFLPDERDVTHPDTSVLVDLPEVGQNMQASILRSLRMIMCLRNETNRILE